MTSKNKNFKVKIAGNRIIAILQEKHIKTAVNFKKIVFFERYLGMKIIQELNFCSKIVQIMSMSDKQK
jgi:hypothetical protein